MKKILLITFILMSGAIFSGCTKKDKAIEYLEVEGFSNIEITGYKWFSCSEDDFYATGFKAEKNGREITGTVCSGLLFKGSTVRYD